MKATLDDELELEARFDKEAKDYFKLSLQRRKDNGQAGETEIGVGIVNHLYDTLAFNMNEWIIYNVTPKRGVKPIYHRLVKWLDSVYSNRDDLVAQMCLSTLMKTLNNVYGNLEENSERHSITWISNKIAEQIISEAQMQEFLNAHEKEVNDEIMYGVKQRKSDYYREYYAFRVMDKMKWKRTQWGKEETNALGGKCLEILLDSSDFFEEFHDSSPEGTDMSQVHATQKLIDTWNVNEANFITHVYRAHPTIIPPQDWTGFLDGGYHGIMQHYFQLLRISSYKPHARIDAFTTAYIDKIQQVDISRVIDAVNAIQRTPWRIDKAVLAVVKEVLAKGGDRAGIPRMEPYEGLPRLENPTEDELKAHKKKLSAIYKKEARRKGRAIRALANVKTAEAFKDYDNIYFPCNMDFRGRIYPIPSFSFQGDDLNKGLIQFANTPPVTSETAIRWFFIAGAEFAGIDKVPFDECVEWVNKNDRNIMDTAEDPMRMIDWWGNLDCPWEFLQFCFEYKKLKEYRDAHDGSAVGWTTGVPVAFDGSCSGLQNFSAILRDPQGAKAVNLMPADRPQDIYGQVAALVNKDLEYDAQQGTIDEWDEEKKKTKYGTKTLAQLWLNFGVNRKVCKRSVMTLAYGSKQFGFRNQILEDTIKPIWDDEGCVFNRQNGNQAAGYLAKLIWNNVGKVVVKAVEGMAWLQKMAKVVCDSSNVVTWTTPMGLPVQQNYLSYEMKIFRMRFARTEKRFYIPHNTGNIDSRKQAQGIAPNFIHSMDASHLQLTVETGAKEGIMHFATIHDSYGTSIEQADRLFHIIRECFVQMYTENDVLQNFFNEIAEVVGSKDNLPSIPEKGNFDIRQILDSLYAFH